MANHLEPAELVTRVHEAYGIAASRIKPFGPVWKLSTPGKEYGLKPFKLGAEQIRELAGIMDGLIKAGFPHLAPLLPTKHGIPWVNIAGRNYSLSPWYDGENPNFRNPKHLFQVARLYGKMHSIGVQSPQISNSSGLNGLLKYRNRTEFLGWILEALSRKCCSLKLHLRRKWQYNRIDRGILKTGRHFLAQAEFCMKALGPYITDEQLINLLPVGFCHHDPAPRNLILHGGELTLIDFELSGLDLYINELATLLNRSLEANQWNEDVFGLVMNAYQMERPLSPLEVTLLPYILLFPQRFWRICRQRYHEELRWTEKRFARRLYQITDQESNRSKFLSGFTGFKEITRLRGSDQDLQDLQN